MNIGYMRVFSIESPRTESYPFSLRSNSTDQGYPTLAAGRPHRIFSKADIPVVAGDVAVEGETGQSHELLKRSICISGSETWAGTLDNQF